MSNDPLHGITLEAIVTRLAEHFGWSELGRLIDIRCFNFDPSVQSSLKFLRRTPWAEKSRGPLRAHVRPIMRLPGRRPHASLIP